MPTVRLPLLLGGDLMTTDLLETFAAHEKPVAIVKRGDRFDLFRLNDVESAAAELGSTGPIPITRVSRVVLPDEYLAGGVGMTWIEVELNNNLRIMLAAPLYRCPKKDRSSSTPADCPVHLIPMVRVDENK